MGLPSGQPRSPPAKPSPPFDPPHHWKQTQIESYHDQEPYSPENSPQKAAGIVRNRKSGHLSDIRPANLGSLWPHRRIQSIFLTTKSKTQPSGAAGEAHRRRKNDPQSAPRSNKEQKTRKADDFGALLRPAKVVANQATTSNELISQPSSTPDQDPSRYTTTVAGKR